MRLDPRQPQRSPVLGKAELTVSGLGSKACCTSLHKPTTHAPRPLLHLPDRGCVSRRHIPPQQIAALRRRQNARLKAACASGNTARKPIRRTTSTSSSPPQEHPAQHAAGNPLRKLPARIGKRQRRPPGPAEQQPPLDPEMAAQGLDVGHQVGRRVVVQQAAQAGATGPAPR